MLRSERSDRSGLDSLPLATQSASPTNRGVDATGQYLTNRDYLHTNAMISMQLDQLQKARERKGINNVVVTEQSPPAPPLVDTDTSSFVVDDSDDQSFTGGDHDSSCDGIHAEEHNTETEICRKGIIDPRASTTAGGEDESFFKNSPAQEKEVAIEGNVNETFDKDIDLNCENTLDEGAVVQPGQEERWGDTTAINQDDQKGENDMRNKRWEKGAHLEKRNKTMEDDMPHT